MHAEAIIAAAALGTAGVARAGIVKLREKYPRRVSADADEQHEPPPRGEPPTGTDEDDDAAPGPGSAPPTGGQDR